MAEYKLYVRNAALSKVGEIDDFSKLDLILRFNRTGSFVLDVPAGTTTADYLTAVGAGLIVERDGTVLLSGPITKRSRQWDKDKSTLTVAGPDDLIWLERRLAYPEVTGAFGSAVDDVRTDACETVLKEYVDYNAGPNAIAQRRVPGLTIQADTTLGTSVIGRARFDNLLELLQSLALAGGDLGFRIVQSGAGIIFQVYDPSDLTATIIFSEELGNLMAFDYGVEAAEANYIIAAGGGEGTARTFVEKSAPSSIVSWGRIEQFLDQRQTTDTTELTQAIDKELLEKAEKTNLSISPVDTEAMAFVTDYNLGDKVTVMADGVAIQDILREVKITLDNNGETVTPTVGTPDSTPLGLAEKLFASLRAANKKISNLERR